MSSTVDPAANHPDRAVRELRAYQLVGPDGQTVTSQTPGELGGHRRSKIYGRLDCSAALRALASGHYINHRVFFANEATAVAAGYRPCAACSRPRYDDWRQAQKAPQ